MSAPRQSLESIARSMTSDVLRTDAARLREEADAERGALEEVSGRHGQYFENAARERVAMLERGALASEMMAVLQDSIGNESPVIVQFRWSRDKMLTLALLPLLRLDVTA